MAVSWFWSLIAVVWLATPAVLAFRTDLRTRAFQAQAFGHFRKAARNLRWFVWAVLAYHIGVIATGLVLGDITDMFRYPMPASGVLAYFRIGAVTAGYVFTNLIAQELFLVTQPGSIPLPGDLDRA